MRLLRTGYRQYFCHRNIDGGSLQAGEDISVSGSIIGYGKSRIICSTLYAGYINNAIIEAEKEVKST